MRTRLIVLVAALLLALSAHAPIAAQFVVPVRASVVVEFGSPKQTIDGFGAAESPTTLTGTLADQLFTTSSGIGLTFFRLPIFSRYDGSAGPYHSETSTFWADAKLAGDRGAKLITAPWTALAVDKDNGSVLNGGHLLAGSYGSFSDTLAGFQADLVAQTGYSLYAFEAQNEADFADVNNSTMVYTNAQMTAWVKVLGPKLAALSPAPLLLLPSVANWDNLQGYVTDTLGDGTAAPYVSGLSVHQYSGTPALPTGIGTRHLWQTEMSWFDTFDPSITSALIVAKAMHDALIAGVHAWFYWWGLGQNGDNEGLFGSTMGDTTITKRFYAMGNFSKFVRPGYTRLATVGAVSGISVSAFRSGTAFVVVAINQNSTPSGFYCALDGSTATTATPWITSASFNLSQQPDVRVSQGMFAATLPPLSVTSFVGTGS